jgi:hypothetical protein
MTVQPLKHGQLEKVEWDNSNFYTRMVFEASRENISLCKQTQTI